MGICFSRKNNNRYAYIQKQILSTVREQQQLQIVEDQVKQMEPITDEQISLKLTQSQQILYDGSQFDQEVKNKSGKQILKKKKQKSDNYFPQIEYRISLKGILLELNTDQINSYTLTFNIKYQEYDHYIQCKGILVNHPNKIMELIPNSFEEASKHSRFLPFFQRDNYFNGNNYDKHYQVYFEKLLNVERTIPLKEQIKRSPTKRYSRRQSSLLNLSDNQLYSSSPSPSPQKRKLNISRKQFISYLLEVIYIFDLEYQPKFLQILFILLLQQQFENLKSYLVQINDLIFLFDNIPQMESLNVYRIAIFYENLDYNLSDLAIYMQKEKCIISNLNIQKLTLNLLDIFYNIYSNYCYRINFTLQTIFYDSKSKRFKVAPFCRLTCLLPFGGNKELNLKTVPENKIRNYTRAFKKDLEALCDIIIYFKNVWKSLNEIQQMRKKQNPINMYTIYIQEIFETDSIILDLIKLSFDEINYQQINKVLDEVKSISQKIENDISIQELENNIKHTQNEQKKRIISVHQLSSSIESQEIHGEIQNFDLKMQIQSFLEGNKNLKQKNISYYEILYSSLFFNNNFFNQCLNYQLNPKKPLQNLHIQILKSFLDINYIQLDNIKQMNEGQKIALQPCILEALNIIDSDSQPIYFYFILQLLCLLDDKPLPLIIKFQELLEEQQKLKQINLKLKLNPLHSHYGIIEMRKFVVLQVFYAQYSLQKSNYQNAINRLQKTFIMQQKLNQTNTLLYSYILNLNGQLCAKTFQQMNSMLNLEMCKQLYDQFFPNFNNIPKQMLQDQSQEQNNIFNIASLSQSNIELILGLQYSLNNDQENALKCLRMAKLLREKRYDQFSDQVVEVILYILKLHVQEEENGAATKLCNEISELMNIQYKQKRIFKSKQIGLLQLMIACIYEVNGNLFKSLRYYQRSQKTYMQSKTCNFIRQLYIDDKIKSLIQKIRYIALQLIPNTQQQLTDVNNIACISDILKPLFSNSFYQSFKLNGVLNNNLIYPIIHATGYLRNSEYEESIQRYQFVRNHFTKQKIDECYGIILERLGIIYILKNLFNQGIEYIKLAEELHWRYLPFPLRQYSILKCNLFLLLHNAYNQQQQQCLITFDQIDQLIQKIYDDLQWNLIPEISTRLNKFKIISTKLGIKGLYIIMELFNLIDLYYNIKKILYENFNYPEKLKTLALKYAQTNLAQYSTNKLIKAKAQCQIGRLAKIYIKSKQNLIHSKELNTTTIDSTKLTVNENYRNSQSKINDTTIFSDTKKQIILDLRSAQEILKEREKVKFNQGQKSKRSSQQQIVEQQLEQLEQKKMLKFSDMKVILQQQQKSEKKLTKDVIPLNETLQLNPIIVRGRKRCSNSQHELTDLGQQFAINNSNETKSLNQSKNKSSHTFRKINQKFKLNPFEKFNKLK